MACNWCYFLVEFLQPADLHIKSIIRHNEIDWITNDFIPCYLRKSRSQLEFHSSKTKGRSGPEPDGRRVTADLHYLRCIPNKVARMIEAVSSVDKIYRCYYQINDLNLRRIFNKLWLLGKNLPLLSLSEKWRWTLFSLSSYRIYT